MSKLTETRAAYAYLSKYLDQEVRKGASNVNTLRRHQDALNRAFYLIGWGQFEFLVNERFKQEAEQKAAVRNVDGLAWKYLRDNPRGIAMRQRLDVVLHAKPAVRDKLKGDYDVRNEVAHNNKPLPADAQDLDAWLRDLEEIVNAM